MATRLRWLMGTLDGFPFPPAMVRAEQGSAATRANAGERGSRPRGGSTCLWWKGRHASLRRWRGSSPLGVRISPGTQS
jgi:hypothetical protein